MTTVAAQFSPDELSSLDEWIDRRPEPKPGRAEAVRLLTEIRLHALPAIPKALTLLEQVGAADDRRIAETVEALRAALAKADAVKSV